MASRSAFLPSQLLAEKGKFWNPTLFDIMCSRIKKHLNQTCWSWYHFSQEKIPHSTDISRYIPTLPEVCRSVFWGHPVQRISHPTGVSMRSRHYYPSFRPHAAFQRYIRAFGGINSCWVPIYCTWVERDNCEQNALSKGIRTEWDSNPRTSDCKSRARTTPPQCSHAHKTQFGR